MSTLQRGSLPHLCCSMEDVAAAVRDDVHKFFFQLSVRLWP